MQLLWFAVKSFYHTPRLTESVTKINLAYSNDCYTRFASLHNVQSRAERSLNRHTVVRGRKGKQRKLEANDVKLREVRCVNRHTRESQIKRSFRTHCGTERQLVGAAAGPARSSRRKSTLLAVPSLLDEKELHDEKEFLQQMRAGPFDRRFPLFVGLRCMLFHILADLISPARHGGRVNRLTVLKECLPAEMLPVRGLRPAGHDGLA